MYCSICDSFSRSEEGYLVCTYRNNMMIAFNMNNLMAKCPLKKRITDKKEEE